MPRALHLKDATVCFDPVLDCQMAASLGQDNRDSAQQQIAGWTCTQCGVLNCGCSEVQMWTRAEANDVACVSLYACVQRLQVYDYTPACMLSWCGAVPETPRNLPYRQGT